MPGRLWTIANAGMLLAFAASVVVQINDPDPLAWMAIYGAAAVACGLELGRRTPTWLPALVTVAALAWAATLAPRVLGKVPFGAMFEAFEMKDAGVEESRELYGLLLIAVWMGAVSLAAWRRRAARAVR